METKSHFNQLVYDFMLSIMSELEVAENIENDEYLKQEMVRDLEVLIELIKNKRA